jgi:hypothetical protein
VLLSDLQEEYAKSDNDTDPLQKTLEESKLMVEKIIKNEEEKLASLRLKKKKELDNIIKVEKEKINNQQRILQNMSKSELLRKTMKEQRDKERHTQLEREKEEQEIRAKARKDQLEKQKQETVQKLKEKEELFEKKHKELIKERAAQYEANKLKMTQRMEAIKKGVEEVKEVWNVDRYVYFFNFYFYFLIFFSGAS